MGIFELNFDIGERTKLRNFTRAHSYGTTGQRQMISRIDLKARPNMLCGNSGAQASHSKVTPITAAKIARKFIAFLPIGTFNTRLTEHHFDSVFLHTM